MTAQTDTKLPEWPDADWYRSYSNDDWSTYERARADAAMARLRDLERAARDVLKWYQPFFDWTQNDPECFCSSELICDFDNLEATLKAIGPLPLPQMPTPLPGEGE